MPRLYPVSQGFLCCPNSSVNLRTVSPTLPLLSLTMSLSPVEARSQAKALTLPVVLVVTGARQSDEAGKEQRCQEGAETPGFSLSARSKAAQLACQVEGGKGQTSEGDWKENPALR